MACFCSIILKNQAFSFFGNPSGYPFPEGHTPACYSLTLETHILPCRLFVFGPINQIEHPVVSINLHTTSRTSVASTFSNLKLEISTRLEGLINYSSRLRCLSVSFLDFLLLLIFLFIIMSDGDITT